MQVSVCLGAILIPEYLDSILAILLPGAAILIPEYLDSILAILLPGAE